MTQIDDTQFQKNAEILRVHWTAEVEETLEEIGAVVREEFYSGVWGFLLNRLVAGVYDLFFSKDIKSRIFKQFDVVLYASKDLDEGNVERVIEKYFEEYLFNDPGFARIKKRHKKVSELRDRLRKSFLLIVKGTSDLLQADGGCYDDLFVDAYKTRGDAERAVLAVINDAAENLDFVIEHGMMKISALIRKQTIKILRKEIAVGRDHYVRKLDALFGE